MTAQEPYKLLRGKSKEIDEAVGRAYQELISRIRGGESPREAVAAVMATFTGEYAEIYAAGLSLILSESIGAESALSRPVGRITLSQRLYAQSEASSVAVTAIVDRHARGFQQSRRLALDLFEGYDFNEVEVLNINPRNSSLPRYMRTELLRDPKITSGFKRAFSRIQVEGLRTPELRAAYTALLDDVDKLEQGAGQVYLERKINVAFNERLRYFAKRIAETELHRNFAELQAQELLNDTAVKYVQWRLSPMHPIEDICDYFAGVDRYGLGPGVYPKELAPVAPAHPFCKCVLAPRLDLNDREPKDNEGAERQFFSRYSPENQRRIAGSQNKLQRIQSGDSAWDVHNEGIDPIYQVKKAEDL